MNLVGLLPVNFLAAVGQSFWFALDRIAHRVWLPVSLRLIGPQIPIIVLNSLAVVWLRALALDLVVALRDFAGRRRLVAESPAPRVFISREI